MRLGAFYVRARVAAWVHPWVLTAWLLPPARGWHHTTIYFGPWRLTAGYDPERRYA